MFGSYARNEQTANSDVDLLLDLGTSENHPYLDYAYDLVDSIEVSIKLRVDFITTNGIKINPSDKFKRQVELESWW